MFGVTNPVLFDAILLGFDVSLDDSDYLLYVKKNLFQWKFKITVLKQSARFCAASSESVGCKGNEVVMSERGITWRLPKHLWRHWLFWSLKSRY